MSPLEPVPPMPTVREPDPAPRVSRRDVATLTDALGNLATATTARPARQVAELVAALIDTAIAEAVDRMRLELAEAIAETALVGDVASRPDRAAMLEAIAGALGRHAELFHRRPDATGLSS